MAKRQDELTPAEDYIDQLQWRSRHGRRSSVHFEPKWKYKIVYRYPPLTLLDRAIHLSVVIGIALLLAYIVGSDALIEQVGMRIFFGIVFGLIFIILFFAIRDASREDQDHAD